MRNFIYFSVFIFIFCQTLHAQPPQVRKKAMNLPPKSAIQVGFYTGKDWLMKVQEKEGVFLYVNGKKQGICSNLEDVSPENSLSRTIVATEKMPQTGYQTHIYFGANKKWENLPFPQIKIYFDAEDTIVECWKNAKYLQETRFLNGKNILSEDSLHQRKVILNGSGKGYSVWLTDNQKVWVEKSATEKMGPYSVQALQNATASEDGKNWIWAAQEMRVLSVYFNGNRIFGLPSMGKDSLAIERIILAPDGKEYAFQAKYPATDKSFLFFSNRKSKELAENIVPNSLCYGVFFPKTWSWLAYQNGENPVVMLHHSTQKTDIFPPYFENSKNANPPHFIWDSKRKNAILTYNKTIEGNPQNYYFCWKNGKSQEIDGTKILKAGLSENGNSYFLEKKTPDASALILRTDKTQMAFFATNYNLIFTPSENYWWTQSSEWFDDINKPNLNMRSKIHYEITSKKAFWLEYTEKGEVFLCERELP